MAIKGSPRDMKKWLELLLDPNIQFPGESSEYRRARNQLLESERELRRMNQQVAAQRRALLSFAKTSSDCPTGSEASEISAAHTRSLVGVAGHTRGKLVLAVDKP